MTTQPAKNAMIKVADLPGPFCVICEECRIFHFLDREQILAHYGNEVDAYDVIKNTARDLVKCSRTAETTPIFQKCRLTGYHTREQQDALKKVSPGLQPTPRDIRQWEMIVAVCIACRHVSEINRATISRIIGPDTPLVSICKRLRCKGCGAKGQVQISIVQLARGPR